jgi:hypothetical protein
MELPQELLKIVREFSKPCFPYLREYKEAMRALDLNEWPELKKKLYTSDAVSVMELLGEYVHAYKEKKQTDDEFNDYVDQCKDNPRSYPYTCDLQSHWAEMARLRDECEEAFLLADDIFQELNKILEKS